MARSYSRTAVFAATASAISNSLIDLGNAAGTTGIVTGSAGFKSDFCCVTTGTGAAAAGFGDGFDNGGAGTLIAESALAGVDGAATAKVDNH